MNRMFQALAAVSLGAGLGFGVSPADAADPPKPAPAAKPAPAKPAAKKAPAKKAPPPPPETPPPEADLVQNAAAEKVIYGEYQCEFKQVIQIERNPKYAAYADVVFGKQRFTMKPVVSPIGAVRLEDVRGKTLMIQIAYKSMLLDVQAGQRLVDECVHENQAAAKREADRVAAEQPASAAAGDLLSGGAATAAAAPAAPAAPAASAAPQGASPAPQAAAPAPTTPR